MATDRLEPDVQHALDDVGAALRYATRAQHLRWSGPTAQTYRDSLADTLLRLGALRSGVESALRTVRALDAAPARSAGLGMTGTGSAWGAAGVCGG
ncbi:hypothetical protein [Cellulomonas soli]